jgi:hypothetical protein
MADAERDRLDLTAQIEQLQMDKQELEAANAAKIEENRTLLDQLEALNNTAIESDAKIRTLEASLMSSMQAVRRLESGAARAAVAERHLAVLEEEQDKLHRELRISREDARTHSQRFKEAQRGITDMQDQLERMETEAHEERQRHADVVQRMERQRDMDKQLDTAAGRLKGAAATRSLQSDPKNTKIIGHFVRDLLQDNANLQLGIAELREMLMNSNDEIQSLREQLMYHQPIDEKVDSPASTLKAELESHGNDDPAPHTGHRLSQELHIHHHYHVSPAKEPKKPKKKRQGLLPGIFTPPASSSVPSTPPQTSGQWGIPSSPTAPSVLSHEYDETTPTTSKPPAWLGAENPPSDFSSSVPSSPFSNGRAVFDTNYADSSDPLTSMTSPTTSFDPSSPTWRAVHAKHASFASSHSFQSLSCLDYEPDLPHLSSHCQSDDAIPEADEYAEQDTNSVIHEPTSDNVSERDHVPDIDTRPLSSNPRNLHRVTSHESIMSLTGGLDIHTLKMRPSQMMLRPLGGADAVVTGVVAEPTLSRASTKRSDVALRDNFIGLQSPRTASSPLANSAANSGRQTSSSVQSLLDNTPGSSGLRGWVAWRPWNSSSSPNPSSASKQSTPKPSEKGKDKDAGRSPGINQPGAIPGFQEYWTSQKRKGAPANVNAATVDHSALTDGLRE